MFGRNKTTKKIDNLITGVIIGSAIASIFGLSKTKKGQKITKDISTKSKGIFSKIYEKFGKTMCRIVTKKNK